jgi:hypothetical protein
MCCFLMVLMLVGPRAAILVWWIVDTARWTLAFSGSWIWPLLGFIFLPWTTLAYVLVAPGGLVLFDWIILGLGFLIDMSSWFGGYRGRKEVPYYN